ncbi:MAG: hypothetical protein DMF56_15565 [Acidobacteria bacterium]|nr:MAG: hypothetical protein DMF56_15565 [Acidobacteriota bacterium]
MPREHFFTLRNFVRFLLFGYAIGGVMMIIFATAGRDKLSLQSVAQLAFIGLFMTATIWSLEYLIRGLSGRLSPALQLPLHLMLAAGGGVLGFILGRSAYTLLFFGRIPSLRSYGTALIVIPLVCLLTGAGMFFYIVLEERLRDKVREQELAQQELTLARAIQERLLPPPEFTSDGFRVTARNLAAHYVAGDFYDLIARADGSVVAVVADVAGKGVAASLIMASVKSVLPLIASVESVEGTMRRLNEKLAKELGKREFVALACATYDPSTRRVVLANAGLPDPYLIRNGTATPLVVGGPRLPLGIRASLDYESMTIELERGDRLLLLTDGLPEATVGEDEPIGYVRLEQLASAHASLEALFAAIERETEEPRGDDWTAMMLEVTR